VESDIKRITANLPSGLLEEAIKTTGEGITETLIAGLKLVKRAGAYQKAMALKGTMILDLDVDVLRARHR
jgi:hypothetical protein